MILGDEKGIEDTFIINPKIVDLKTISEWWHLGKQHILIKKYL